LPVLAATIKKDFELLLLQNVSFTRALKKHLKIWRGKMFAKKGFSNSMLRGVNDLTFIQFGNPAHFKKRAVPFSDMLFENADQTASCMVPKKQFFRRHDQNRG
jgi:hypothetical protein